MNTKERIKERVNDINDPRLLNELLKVVELEHDIEHTPELSDIEKKQLMKELQTLMLGICIRTLKRAN